MNRIGVISDTHNLLRPEIVAELKKCDAIIHAGDVCRPEILDELGRLSFLYAVRGNNDHEWASHLRTALEFQLYGLHFLLVHNKKDVPPAKKSNADIIIYGHSHRFEMNYIGNQLWLNPGSCGPKRFTQPPSMAVLEIEQNKIDRIIKIEV